MASSPGTRRNREYACPGSEDLNALAAAAGVMVDWVDASDQPRQVSEQSVHAVLTALELPAATAAQRADSLRRCQAQAAEPAPLLTVQVGELLPLRVAADTSGAGPTTAVPAKTSAQMHEGNCVRRSVSVTGRCRSARSPSRWPWRRAAVSAWPMPVAKHRRVPGAWRCRCIRHAAWMTAASAMLPARWNGCGTRPWPAPTPWH